MQTYYETERLILRILTPDCCHSVLHFYVSNREFFEPFDPHYPSNYFTADYQRSSLQFELNAFKKGAGCRFYLFTKERPGTIIGTISFNHVIYGFQQSASVGYKFDQNHLHRGFATEGLKKGIEIMFTEVGLRRLEAFILPNNRPSKKLIKRLQFSYEGICRSHALINNCWRDHEQYSLLAPTFLHQYPN